MPGGSYQLEFLLKSPDKGLEQRFTSRIMNDDDQKPALIVKVEETSRKIVLIGVVLLGNLDHYDFVADVRYNITLEDGLVYKVCYIGSFHSDKKKAETELDNFQIDVGDSILLGKYNISPMWGKDWQFDEKAFQITTYPTIYHGEKTYVHTSASTRPFSHDFGPKLSAQGPERLPQVYHPKNTFRVGMACTENPWKPSETYKKGIFTLDHCNQGFNFWLDSGILPKVEDTLTLKNMIKLGRNIYIFEDSMQREIIAHSED